MSGIAQLWSRVKDESAVLQRRLRLLGLSEGEIEAVLEETLLRVLASAGETQAELLPVVMYGMAVRVTAARRAAARELGASEVREGHDAHEAWAISAREMAALRRLPFRQRVAVVGVDVAGHAVTEVADVLGIAPEEVDGLLRDGRAKLAEIMQCDDMA